MNLNLTLKKKWFDMILSGEKKEEYREVKPYWNKRLLSFMSYDWLGNLRRDRNFEFTKFDTIMFKNGYSKDAPEIIIECKEISIGNAVPEWSDNWQANCS